MINSQIIIKENNLNKMFKFRVSCIPIFYTFKSEHLHKFR